MYGFRYIVYRRGKFAKAYQTASRGGLGDFQPYGQRYLPRRALGVRGTCVRVIRRETTAVRRWLFVARASSERSTTRLLLRPRVTVRVAAAALFDEPARDFTDDTRPPEHASSIVRF